MRRAFPLKRLGAPVILEVVGQFFFPRRGIECRLGEREIAIHHLSDSRSSNGPAGRRVAMAGLS